MMRIAAIIALGLVLAGCSSSNNPSISIYQPPLSPTQWTILFSPSMPAVMPVNASGQSYFDFNNNSTATGGVHYVVFPAPASAGKTIHMTFSLVGTGTLGQNDPSDTGNPTLRLFLWEKGDDMSGTGPFAWFRWWSNPVTVQLISPNTYSISVPLTADQWSSVYGLEGNSSTAATVGFTNAVANLYAVGFTFGGEFAGHGNYLKSGSVRFILNSFTIQ